MSKAPRISLLSLLLGVGVAAALVATFVSERRRHAEAAEAARENASLLAELEELRIEQGHLVVDDASRAYVVQVLTEDEWIGGDAKRWRYRVYLPELSKDANYVMKVCEGTIPTSGFPEWNDWHTDHPGPELSYGLGGQSIRAGENLIDFALVEDEDGWRLRYTFKHGGGGSAGVQKADWVSLPNRSANLSIAKVRTQQAFDPLEPIPLMRLAERTGDLNDRFEGLRRGILVYVEPAVTSPIYFSGPLAADSLRKRLDELADK